MIELRKYQQRTNAEVRRLASQGIKKLLMVLPTGAGKTFTLCDIAITAINKGHKVLCLMHRRGLVDQMIERFAECGLDSGCIMAGKETDFDKQCQIASLWTYVRRMNLDALEMNRWFIPASVVLVDEAHHVLSKTYQKVLKNYENAFVIGCTATPTLSTGAGLGNYFDGMVNVVSMDELLAEKHLVPGVYYGPTEPDLTKLKIVQGDFDKKGLDEKVNKPQIIGDVVENWLKLAHDKQTMVFAINRKHGKALCREFEKHGIMAEYLDAHSDDDLRNEVLDRFRSRTTQVICQVALYTEGTDIKEIECLVIARPTRSLGLHRQILGRGARPNNGKESFLVLDHGGNVKRLGFYEDEVAWTLDGKPNATKIKKPRKKEKRLMTCSECSSIFTGRRCPRCGYEIPDYTKKIEAFEAELVELGRNKKKPATTEEKRIFYGMLEYERRLRGYAQGWTAQQFRTKFGVWPNHYKDQGPIEPDTACKNWLTYQRIRWFKSKKRKEMQDAA